MPLSIARFFMVSRLIGGLLTLMGLALLAVFGVFLATGLNPLAPGLDLDAAGMLIFATVGAFQLPLGLSLLGRDARTSFRLRIAAGALGGMALLRLLAFLHPTTGALLGLTPLVEAVFFGLVGLAALVVRPESEAPIEIVREFDLPAPASEVWHLVGTRFGDLAEYASLVRAVELDGPVGVGATRTCHSEPFGPFASTRVSETLTEFDPSAMRFAYEAGGELPAFIPASRNRWSVLSLGPEQSRIRCHASVELSSWAVPLAPVLAWFISSAVDQFGTDLRTRMARRAPVPSPA